MVCCEIITCPLVQQLRGDLRLCRIIYCETSSKPCALRALLGEGKPIPITLLPSGDHREHPASPGTEPAEPPTIISVSTPASLLRPAY